MLDRVLRAPKDRLMAPLAVAIGSAVHPTAITLASFVLGLACVAMIAIGTMAGALLFWIANRLLDGLDGAVARHRARQSDLGGYVDIVLDMVIYALIPIAAAVAAPEQPGLWLALACMLASFYINAGSWMYLAAILEKRGRGAADAREGTSVTFPGGLVEGAETMILFTLMILFPAYLGILFWITAALVSVTAVQRLVWGARWL